MKTVQHCSIIFGIVLWLALSVLSRRPEPTLPAFPSVFSATFNESDLAPWRGYRMNNVFLDLPNKRASINFISKTGKTEAWTLIYKPQGADPNAPASQDYTMFTINPSYPAMVPNNCMYTTGSHMTLSPFPEHWKWYEGKKHVLQVSAWLDLPSDLVYGGEYFITELGVMSDRWDTVSQCYLQQSGIGQVPCTSVMFSQGQNPLPLMDIRAYGARPDSFQYDKYVVRVYHSFSTTVQNSNFALPKNWPINCGNADNDFVTKPDSSITVFNNGGPLTPLSIGLTSPPIAGLGEVQVFLSPSPTSYYNCVDCVDFEVPVLRFNSDNWDTPQKLPMVFANNGCSQYSIKATGGGYNWTYNTRSVAIYACEGTKPSGCYVPPKCGA